MSGTHKLRQFSIGIVVGVMIGSAGVAVAAFGYKGWNRFDEQFRVGYITGFLDMSDIARNSNPDGYVDQMYPRIPKARPSEYAMVIGQLYKDPQNQNSNINTLINLATRELEKKYGPGPSVQERLLNNMKQQLAARQARLKAAGVVPPPKKVAPEKGDGKSAPAVEKEPFPKLKNKKWCRCDGLTPKEAHAARRAKKEAEKDQKPAGQSE